MKVETPTKRACPVILILPLPVIVLPLRSKLPPSWGEVSFKTSVIPPPPLAVIVTRPADTALTERPVPKLIVAAVPTAESLSLISTPLPVPVTPVKPEPSPTNDVAVIIPVERASVILLPTMKSPSSTLTVPLEPPPFNERPDEAVDPASRIHPLPFPRYKFGLDV